MKNRLIQILSFAIFLSISAEYVQGMPTGPQRPPQPVFKPAPPSTPYPENKTNQPTIPKQPSYAAPSRPNFAPPIGNQKSTSHVKASPQPNNVLQTNARIIVPFSKNTVLRDGFSITDGDVVERTTQTPPPPSTAAPVLTPAQKNAGNRILANFRSSQALKSLTQSNVNEGPNGLNMGDDGQNSEAPTAPTNQAASTPPQTLSGRAYSAAGNAATAVGRTVSATSAAAGKAANNTYQAFNRKKPTSTDPDTVSASSEDNSTAPDVSGPAPIVTPSKSSRTYGQMIGDMSTNLLSRKNNQLTNTAKDGSKIIETRSKPTKENPDGTLLATKTIAPNKKSYKITDPNNNVTEQRAENGVVTKSTYNKITNKRESAAVTSADWKTTTETQYDADNRPTKVSIYKNGKLLSMTDNTYEGSRLAKTKTRTEGKNPTISETNFDASNQPLDNITETYHGKTLISKAENIYSNGKIKQTMNKNVKNQLISIQTFDTEGGYTIKNAKGDIIKEAVINKTTGKLDITTTKAGYLWGKTVKTKTIDNPNDVAQSKAAKTKTSTKTEQESDTPSWLETPETEPSKVQENVEYTKKNPSWLDPKNDGKQISRATNSSNNDLHLPEWARKSTTPSTPTDVKPASFNSGVSWL